MVAFGARAQTDDNSEWNHFGLDFRLGLNIKARFSYAAAAAVQPPPAAGGVDHTYSDGFVRLDSSGDQGGQTWNWGYQNASQVPGNGTVLMHSPGGVTGASDRNDDPRLGFEVNYVRDLAHLGWGRVGVKLAFGYTDLNIHDSQPLNGNASLITDAYSLGSVTPPLAPYSGSFNGPGPVIGDTPSRTISSVPGGVLITGNRQMDATLYDWRLGPFVELSLSQRLSCQVGGGLAVGLAQSTFSFSDVTTTSGGTVQAAGSTRNTDALVGFYGEAGLAYEVVSAASFFAGAQFQYLGDFNQSVGGRNAQIDLKKSVFFVVGLQWRF